MFFQENYFYFFINLVDKCFIFSIYMDKLYKVKLFLCFRNKYFINGNEVYCIIMFICQVDECFGVIDIMKFQNKSLYKEQV